MFILDIPWIVSWYFMFLLIGFIFLPITVNIFNSLFDRGYIFAKIVGLLFISYAIFFFGTVRLLPFTQTSILLCVFLFAAVSIFLLKREEEKIIEVFNKSWKFFLLEETLFLTALLFWSFIRGHEPSIHGLEKYMDFGFVNSILRSDYFPPKDLWLTPLTINYYYFGQLMTAVLIKLSGSNSAISYNLMIATLFAFTFAGAFSFGINIFHAFIGKGVKNIRLSVASGLLSGFLVSLGGNLHTIYAFFNTYDGEHPVPFWTLPFHLNWLGYWYPNATRFIPFTIHEFPIYSFVVSDLHGHVLSIPIVLTTITVLLQIFISKSLSKIKILLLSFLLATAYMTNAWDAIIYFFLVTGTIVLVKLKKFSRPDVVSTFYDLLLLTVGAFLFVFPFSLTFKPFVSGIGVICAPDFLIQLGKLGPFLFEAEKCGRSPLWQFLVLWGFFYFFAISFLIFLRKKKIVYTDVFILILILLSTVLLIFPEFFYAKDIYPAHYRANTMFKLGYQAFMMLALSSAYIIIRIVSSIKYYVLRMSTGKKILTTCYTLVATFFLFLVAIYPYFAVNGYYGNLRIYRGIDGLTYLRDLYPTDYYAILWIQKNIVGQPVILEAAGESYTDYARISANTGLPTVIGWPVHEWLWRGSYDEAGKRVTEVEQIYTTSDIEQAKALITKYNVAYVFIGILERQKYQNLDEEKFKILGSSIYQNGQTVIYQLHSYL